MATSAGRADRTLDQPALLADGIAAVGLSLDSAQQRGLLDYLALLGKWNAVYNLTAIREPRQMLIQHVLDSLAIVPALRLTAPPGAAVLDVGSGGGMPGMVLALAEPHWYVTLNDIVHKKTAFLTQAKVSLGLTRVSVVTGRVELLQLGVDIAQRFDMIVSRAFADLVDFVTMVRPLVTPGGVIWAMKGVRPDAEIARLPEWAIVEEVIRLDVPMLAAERHLLKITVKS
jgi:16S rRNA (guanine527-N7)-methyltransferase